MCGQGRECVLAETNFGSPGRDGSLEDFSENATGHVEAVNSRDGETRDVVKK